MKRRLALSSRLVARHIHELSRLPKGCLVPGNCAAVVETLVEPGYSASKSESGRPLRPAREVEQPHEETLLYDKIRILPAVASQAVYDESSRKPAVETHMSKPEISSIAPFFIVKNVPAALSFYRHRLGFDITFQGPADDIFFDIVQRGPSWW